MDVWYTAKWPQLRSVVIKISSTAVDEISAYLQQPNDLWVNGLIEIIQQGLQYHLEISQQSDSEYHLAATEKYSHALTLFAHAELLERALRNEKALMKCDSIVQKKPIILNVVKKFLEDSRRSLYHHGDPQKKRDIENWEKIDRLSKQVISARYEHLSQPNRCCNQHFAEVAQAAKADSHNGVQNVEKIAELFWNFCPDCLSLVPDYEEIYSEVESNTHHPVSVTSSELMILQGLLPDESLGDECLELLQEHEPKIFEAIAVKWKLETDVTYLSEQAYYKGQGLSYRAYTKSLETGMELLTDCITDHANSRLQEAKENNHDG